VIAHFFYQTALWISTVSSCDGIGRILGLLNKFNHTLIDFYINTIRITYYNITL
jgi:hypothetical protein